MKTFNRRQFIVQGAMLALTAPKVLGDPQGSIIPLVTGPETDRFKTAQKRVLAKYGVRARFKSDLVGPTGAQHSTHE